MDERVIPPWWRPRSPEDDAESIPSRWLTPRAPKRPGCDYANDGSISALSMEATGVRLIRAAPDVVLFEIDRDGEEATFLQVRSVGKASQVRVVITGDAG